MKLRWLWPLATLLLLLLVAHQYDTLRQLQGQIAGYDAKVTNAFAYTTAHMNLDELPTVLDALVAQPDLEHVKQARTAAAEYSNLLGQLNDLRESGPPLPDGGLLIDGGYSYHAATQAQKTMALQIWRARLWPPLYTIGVLLHQNNGQLRPEDRQFLADAATLVRKLNARLASVQAGPNQPLHAPGTLDLAKRKVGEIGPGLDELAARIQAYTATLPK